MRLKGSAAASPDHTGADPVRLSLNLSGRPGPGARRGDERPLSQTWTGCGWYGPCLARSPGRPVELLVVSPRRPAVLGLLARSRSGNVTYLAYGARRLLISAPARGRWA